jgi:hypothetical protein
MHMQIYRTIVRIIFYLKLSINAHINNTEHHNILYSSLQVEIVTPTNKNDNCHHISYPTLLT